MLPNLTLSDISHRCSICSSSDRAQSCAKINLQAGDSSVLFENLQIYLVLTISHD